MGRCEWNPEKNEAATGDEGCPAEAVFSVGSDKNWHLCESCAALPAFKRFRRRVRLKQEDVVVFVRIPVETKPYVRIVSEE